MPMVLMLTSSCQSVSGQVIWRSWRLIGPPALFTRMWTVPKRSAAAAAAAFTDAVSRMSVGTAITRTPVAAWISSAARSSVVLAARQQDDVHALVGQAARDVLADALAGTGNQRDAVFESKVHNGWASLKAGPYERRGGLKTALYNHLSGSVRPATTSFRNSAARAPSITR